MQEKPSSLAESMAQARTLARRGLTWQHLMDFFAAHTTGLMGALLFLLVAIFLVWPIIVMLGKSVLGPEGFTLEYYKYFFSRSYYYRSFLNTLVLGLMVTPLSIGIAFCIAYITTRGPTYLRRPLRMMVFLPLMAPPFLFALTLIVLLGRAGIFTTAFNLDWTIYGFAGCVLAQTLWMIPLSYMMIESTLSSLNPNLEDSAANLGASEGRILRTITIPLLIPGFVKAFLIVYVTTVSAFGNLILLAGRVPFLAPDIYINAIGKGDFNMASVLSMALILPCVIIFIVQNYVVRGKAYTTIGGKPTSAEPRHIGPHILIPILAVSFIATGLILLCFGVIIAGAFTKNIGIDNTLMFSYILDKASNTAVLNSIKMSLLAGLLGGMLGVLLAYVTTRGKFRGRAILEGISLSGFTLPGVVLGLGYIFAFNQPPLLLTGTLAILVFNSAFRQLGIGEEAGIAKLQQLSIEVEEASLNLGASTITTFRRIVLPIIFPAFLYGFLYVFILSMIGLASVIFLISPGYDLGAVYIFQMAELGKMGLAMATTLKLVIITGICFLILHASAKRTGLNVTRKGGG